MGHLSNLEWMLAVIAVVIGVAACFIVTKNDDDDDY